ncbi:hypothetical protein GCM10009828_065810 [Actinoplanes couchii]|uniref:Uncharacterized protein n=1 Tax=Actinoplanes couchii TaxID=403638 RepID=A0ABQ3X2T9_9ACTN|nr:hypothetical protein Aco03nite_012000 [Actinoplanes couchii]
MDGARNAPRLPHTGFRDFVFRPPGLLIPHPGPAGFGVEHPVGVRRASGGISVGDPVGDPPSVMSLPGRFGIAGREFARHPRACSASTPASWSDLIIAVPLGPTRRVMEIVRDRAGDFAR